MSDPIVSPLQAGEIIPRCGCTLDVIVADLQDIAINGKPLSERPHRVVKVCPEEHGLLRVRLDVWGGDRLMVRTPGSKVGDQ